MGLTLNAGKRFSLLFVAVFCLFFLVFFLVFFFVFFFLVLFPEPLSLKCFHIDWSEI